jgi:glutathione S-transferase
MKPQKTHLVSHVLCPYVQRSIIVLEEKSIAYTRTDIDLANKPEWFNLASPMGKVPVLLINKHKSLFESSVICEYLDDITLGSLHPKDKLEKARHRAWIEFGSGILNFIGSLYNATDKKSFTDIRAEIQQKFQRVEGEILGSPFFSGEKFHLIDAVYGPVFRYFDVFDRFIALDIFCKLPRTRAWRYQLQQRKSVQLAVTPKYPELLIEFLRNRNSYLSNLIASDI